MCVFALGGEGTYEGIMIRSGHGYRSLPYPLRDPSGTIQVVLLYHTIIHYIHVLYGIQSDDTVLYQVQSRGDLLFYVDYFSPPAAERQHAIIYHTLHTHFIHLISRVFFLQSDQARAQDGSLKRSVIANTVLYARDTIHAYIDYLYVDYQGSEHRAAPAFIYTVV